MWKIKTLIEKDDFLFHYPLDNAKKQGENKLVVLIGVQ